MKELSIEEKAKAYDKAIKKAKKDLEVCEQDCLVAKQIFRYFPELAMSEDEKVRKGLINGFKQCVKDSLYPKNAQKYWHNIKIEDILAWLEKQKAVDVLDEEEKEFADNVDSYRKDMDEFYKKGYNADREAEKQYWLEKQGEEKVQAKSLWHEYNHPIDKDRLFLLISKNKRASIMSWNGESLKSVTFGGGGGIILEGDKFAYIDELQEIQNPAEWSEEDERMYKAISIALSLNEAKGYLKSWYTTQEEADNWLKSLKEGYTWKPSEEQMEALFVLLPTVSYGRNPAFSLYNDLKKLKGE